MLIAPKDSKIDSVSIERGFDLAGLLGNGRIAIGDVRSVPAGLYAKVALEKLGLRSSVELKLVMAENVRAALVLVARREAPLGIVYETDARIDPGVKIVGVFPRGITPTDHLTGCDDQKCKIGSNEISCIFDHAGSESRIRTIRFSRAGEIHAVIITA